VEGDWRAAAGGEERAAARSADFICMEVKGGAAAVER
jgi:hypothetical protein